MLTASAYSLSFFAFLNIVASLPTSPITISANPAFPDPNVDSFYDVPSNISAYTPGQVIRSRSVTTEIIGPYSSSYQVLFRTSDTFDNASATVATMWIPDVPSTPAKVFAYQFAEDADNLDCDPSWAWISGSGSNAQSAERVFQGPILIPWALGQGYYVVSTDAEGPLSSFLVGLTEGHAVLDAIRATIAFRSLPAQSEIALYGYSGAAHTTVWACSAAESYAKELNLVGAVFGGTPIDPRSGYIFSNDSDDTIIAGAAIFGLANAYPQLNATLNQLLTPQGKQIAANLRAEKNCSNLASGETDYFNYSSIFTQDILDNAVVDSILKRESLLSNVSSQSVPVPKFPRLQYHSSSDELVPYGPEAAYVQQQCAAGANIAFNTYGGLSHTETAVVGFLDAVQFVQQAFAGTTPKVVCGSSTSVVANVTDLAVAVLEIFS